VAQLELCISQEVIPNSPRFYHRAEGSSVAHSRRSGRSFSPPEQRLRSELAL